MTCISNVGTMQDYVVVCEWAIIGGNETKTMEMPICGQAFFSSDPSKSNFVPYQDISEDLAIEWVKQSLGPDGVNEVLRSIDYQLEISNPPLPWASNKFA